MGQNNISAVWVKSREDLDQEGVELKECGGGGAWLFGLQEGMQPIWGLVSEGMGWRNGKLLGSLDGEGRCINMLGAPLHV